MNEQKPDDPLPVDQGPTSGVWDDDLSLHDQSEDEIDIAAIVRDKTLVVLNPLQEEDFISEMQDWYQWLLKKGNKIDERDPRGQEETTATNYLQRFSRIAPEIWEQNGRYTLQFSNEMGDWYIAQLRDDEITKENGLPYADSSKRKQACCLLNYYRFRYDMRNGDPWEPFTLFDPDSGSHVADPIKLDERRQISEAALTYKTVKRYNNCTPEERDRIKAELAQRLGKPKSEVTKKDWKTVNRCYKWPSIIMMGLDAGLRPVEVARIEVDWIHLSDGTLHIPREDAAKSDKTWEVQFTERTKKILEKWIRQRAALPKYDESDLLWLTREGNPYSSGPLGRNLRNVMDEAGIDYEDRDISWYSLRHSLATYLATTADSIEEVRQQMRHKKIESTLRYLEPPDETVETHLEMIN